MEDFQFEQPKHEKKELPMGEARKISESVASRWRERMVLLSRVRNRVLDVNEEVNLPLRLEKNKQSPLGLFVEATFGEKPEKPAEIPGKQRAEFWPHHERSAVLGRVLFNDKQGGIWRDIDLKGIGHLKQWFLSSSPSEIVRIEPLGLKGHNLGTSPESGLFHRDTAFVDWDLSEQFIKAGIRTHRALAIIQLDELITEQGEKITLKEARKRGIIDADFHPVIEVRGFGTKARVDDLAHSSVDREQKQWSELLLRDALKLIAQEQGKKELFSIKQYLGWFARTLGRNVALMHKNGWCHNYLTEHNITLDCRIVDLDSVKNFSDSSAKAVEEQEMKIEGDLIDARYAFKKLIARVNQFLYGLEYRKNEDEIKHLEGLFHESYDAIFPPDERKKYFQKLLEVA